jgi:hypothetical protein
MTAAQMVVAEALGLRVKSVIIGHSKLAGLTCATDIRTTVDPTPLEALLLCCAASLGFASAGACTVGDVLDGADETMEAHFSKAGAMLAAYGGRNFLEVVVALESYRQAGERELWRAPT